VTYVIVDVDGTLTTSGDTPNQPLIDALNGAVMSGDYQLEVVSARSIDRLEETRAWLQEHGVAGVVGVHLNDFEGTPFATGLAFKEYKYGLLVEKYGEDLEYAIDNDAEVRAMALDKYEISAMTPEEALSHFRSEEPQGQPEDDTEDGSPSSDAENASTPEARAELGVPDFMRQNAIRGLDLLEYKGDGLRPNTITEARDLARGRATEDKWRRMRAWIARHLSDLEGVSPIVEGERPTAGQIAHLLWGSGDTTAKANRAYDYAERVVMAMDNEQERTDTEPTETPVEAPTEAPADAPIEAPAEYHAVKGEVETRAYTGELRVDAEARTIVGYAALFNSDSSPMPFVERLAPGAFTRSLGQVAASGKVVKLLHGHDESQMLAATPTSLSLSQDERGLQVTADIIKSPMGDHMLALAQRDPQAIAWSFGFRVIDEDWDGNKRTINEAALHEVSLLTGHTPAYPGTIGLASVRGLAKRRGIEAEGLWKAVSTWLRGDTVAEEDASAIIRAFEGSVTVPTSVRARMLALKERIGE
jgi:HK97 family phage prohead protease